MKKVIIITLCSFFLGSGAWIKFQAIYPKTDTSIMKHLLNISISISPTPTFAASSDDQNMPDDVKEGKEQPIKRRFPDTKLGRQLDNHLQKMVGSGKDAERNYQESIRQLKAEAGNATSLITKSYDRTPKDHYTTRWLMVETLKELKHPSGVNTLARIAESKIPPERWTDDPERFSVDKEAIIRVTATDGLTELSKRGNKVAFNALKRLTKSNDLTIRRAAIRGILASGDYDKQKKLLERLLPKKDHELISLKVTDLRKVPHPNKPEKLVIPVGKNRTPSPKAKQ